MTAQTSSSVALSWTDSDSNAAGYLILRSTGGGTFAQVGKTTSKSTVTFTDSTVASATAYSYEVEAYNSTLISPASSTVTATTPPIAPATLTAAAAGPATMNLAWTDKDAHATGYVVLRSTDNKSFTTIATLSNASANIYSDSSDKSFTGYFYEIEATANGVASAPSNIANAMTLLFAPSNLNVTATTSNSVALGWTESDPNAAGYLILRSTNGTTFTQIAKTTGASVVTYTDATAASATSYTYEVQAYNGTIVSTVSNSVARRDTAALRRPR